jgi:Predicted amidophosphoribosyltransferases
MSTKAAEFLNKWLLNAQFFLWPGHCVVCQKASGLRRDLCLTCEQTLSTVEDPCVGCALPLPPGHPPDRRCGRCASGRRPIYRAVAPFTWQPPVSALVSGYKYHDQLQHGRVLAELLVEVLRESYRPQELPQLLLPVPLHPRRLRDRGYNQALVLARQLGEGLGIAVTATALQRVRDTPPQQGLRKAERKRNLRGAFALAEPDAFVGLSRIALVDDVLTTMSTVETLARLLHRQLPQPVELHAWAIARA